MQDTSTVTTEVNAGTGGSSLAATITGSVTGAYNASTNSSPTTNGAGVATINAIGGTSGTNAIQLASNSNIQFPAFTVEGWVNLSAMPTNSVDILNKGVDTAQNFGLAVKSDGSIIASFAYGATGGTVWSATSSPGLIQATKWAYLAYTFDGTLVRVYLNGLLVLSAAPNQTPAWNTSGSLGVDPTTGQSSGYTFASHPSYQLAELAVYRFALPQERIRAHWLSSNYAQIAAPADPYSTAVTADNPIVWLRMQETNPGNTAVTNIGSLGAAANGTRTYNPVKPAGSPIPTVGAVPSPTTVGATGYLFDGTSSVVGIPVSATVNQALLNTSSGTTQNATRPLSIEMWVYLLTTPSTSYDLGGVYTSGGVYGTLLEAFGKQLCFYAGPGKYVCGSNALSTGQWLHIVGTYTGANVAGGSDISLYVNGVPQNDILTTTAMSPVTIPASGSNFFIGGAQILDGTHVPTPGYISEFAYYNTALSASKVMSHFRAGIVTSSAPSVLATPSGGQVSLTWSAPAISGGTPPVGYKIYRCANTAGSLGCTPTSLVANTNSTATTYNDLTVTNGTVYSYQVAAINTAGSTTQVGPTSSSVYAVSGTIPGQPPTLSAGPSSGSMARTWMCFCWRLTCSRYGLSYRQLPRLLP